jgi:hypothetical protein
VTTAREEFHPVCHNLVLSGAYRRDQKRLHNKLGRSLATPVRVMQELRNERLDGVTEIYVTGPDWPGTTKTEVHENWSRQHWNLTRQGQIYRKDKAEADRLAKAAGHNDGMSARLKNAK